MDIGETRLSRIVRQIKFLRWVCVCVRVRAYRSLQTRPIALRSNLLIRSHPGMMATDHTSRWQFFVRALYISSKENI